MLPYEPEREYFIGKINKEDVELINTTDKVEESKLQIIKKTLTHLAEELNVINFGCDEIIVSTAYEMDLQELKNIRRTKCVTIYSSMLLAEKILNKLGIINYRLIAYREEEPEEIEEIEEPEESDIMEMESDYSFLDREPFYLNLYQYKGEFYALDFAYALEKKQNNLFVQKIYHDMPLQIPMNWLQLEYSEILVQETPRNDTKQYEDLEEIEIDEFLEQQRNQRMKFQNRAGFDR